MYRALTFLCIYATFVCMNLYVLYMYLYCIQTQLLYTRELYKHIQLTRTNAMESKHVAREPFAERLGKIKDLTMIRRVVRRRAFAIPESPGPTSHNGRARALTLVCGCVWLCVHDARWNLTSFSLVRWRAHLFLAVCVCVCRRTWR